ncbi:MAG: hypothetical protein M5U28_22955 [Sandaracinaceae bacterium]|nr:hypothetical protein [Sandaracinaceae bacterium]
MSSFFSWSGGSALGCSRLTGSLRNGTSSAGLLGSRAALRHARSTRSQPLMVVGENRRVDAATQSSIISGVSSSTGVRTSRLLRWSSAVAYRSSVRSSRSPRAFLRASQDSAKSPRLGRLVVAAVGFGEIDLAVGFAVEPFSVTGLGSGAAPKPSSVDSPRSSDARIRSRSSSASASVLPSRMRRRFCFAPLGSRTCTRTRNTSLFSFQTPSATHWPAASVLLLMRCLRAQRRRTITLVDHSADLCGSEQPDAPALHRGP